MMLGVRVPADFYKVVWKAYGRRSSHPIDGDNQLFYYIFEFMGLLVTLH